MTQYALGAVLERRIRHQLEDDQWFVVRSAGSKGPLDLVAFRQDKILFIQCKRGKLRKGEWEALVATADAYHAIPVCADRDGLWYLCSWPQRWAFDPLSGGTGEAPEATQPAKRIRQKRVS